MRATIKALAALAIGMGVFPNTFLKPMEPAVQRVVERVQAHQPLRVAVPPPDDRGTVSTAAGVMPVATVAESVR